MCFLVYWIVSNKPVIYGDNIILTCKTDRRGSCRVRQWFGGHKNKILLYNNGSVDATKYEEKMNVSSTEFSLVIKNYTESDININYTCSCGFELYTKRLGLKDFIGKHIGYYIRYNTVFALYCFCNN